MTLYLQKNYNGSFAIAELNTNKSDMFDADFYTLIDNIDKNTTYVDVVKNRTIGTTGRGLAKVYYSNNLHTLFDFGYAESNNFFQGVTPEQFKLSQDDSKSVAVSAPKDEYVQGMELEEELPF